MTDQTMCAGAARPTLHEVPASARSADALGVPAVGANPATRNLIGPDGMDQGDNLLVRGGRCLDVVAGEWRRVDVRIQDGRIDEVGAALPAGPGVRTLDVTGSY